MSTEKPSAIATFKQRDAWSHMVAREPRVKLSHRNVLRSLALCMRVDKDGKLVCNPTYEELGEASLCNRRTAMRAVAAGEAIGIIRKARQSDGRVSNGFELLMASVGANGDKTCHRLKGKRKEVESKKEKQEGAIAPLLSLQTRESNAPNGLTASA